MLIIIHSYNYCAGLLVMQLTMCTSMLLEHQRIFQSFRRSRRSTLPYARPHLNQWSQKFFCLASKDALQVPMARAQKLALTSSSLGEKQWSVSFTAVKPAVQLLQIQEVHPVAHSSACNFCRFLSIFLTCSI